MAPDRYPTFSYFTLLFFCRGDNPLAQYRPDGPIKFNVQRAQAAQQAMGVSLSPSGPPLAVIAPAYPGVNMNGYSPQINGYGPPDNDIYQQQAYTQNLQYTSYY